MYTEMYTDPSRHYLTHCKKRIKLSEVVRLLGTIDWSQIYSNRLCPGTSAYVTGGAVGHAPGH